VILNAVSSGNPSGASLVLAHALGCDLSMYDALAEALGNEFDILRFDARGHGGSTQHAGPYTLWDMADDAAALIRERCAGGPVHVAGVSMGGMLAQALASRHPSLVQSIVVANSAQHYDELAQAAWAMRVDTVQALGIRNIADGAMQRWFTPEFRAAQPAVVAKARAVLEACHPASYIAACQAVAAIDFRQTNTALDCPALIVAGSRDEATPPAMSQAIFQTIPHSELVTLNTAHLSAVEAPDALAAEIRGFLHQVF
jgi:3-oxoadipate enol-lactonase